MRKFKVRWWIIDPRGRYNAEIAALEERARQEAARPFYDREYTPGHGLRCGCPGCSFMWAGEQAFLKFGPPPVIGTFDPEWGDYGRDVDEPTAVYRIWMGDHWWPSYEMAPRGLARNPAEIGKP